MTKKVIRLTIESPFCNRINDKLTLLVCITKGMHRRHMSCESISVLYSSFQMSQDAKKPVSVNCLDDAKATDSGVVSPIGNGDGGDNDFVSKKQRSESSDRFVVQFTIRKGLPNRPSINRNPVLKRNLSS